MGKLEAETLSGIPVSFSEAAYHDAMERYGVRDIQSIVEKLESRNPWRRVDSGVADFFRDFAAIQEQDHPDFDRGIAIGSLATRIELATGQVPEDRMDETLRHLEVASVEYGLVFG